MRPLWIEFGALTLLVLFLIGRVWRRWGARLADPPPAPPGHGFDAHVAKQRLRQVRKDHCRTLQPRCRTSEHDFLVLAVRCSVRERSYFRATRPTAPGEADPIAEQT
jgi:hypothetical protein